LVLCNILVVCCIGFCDVQRTSPSLKNEVGVSGKFCNFFFGDSEYTENMEMYCERPNFQRLLERIPCLNMNIGSEEIRRTKRWMTYW
jgi:hypothetical protein